MESKGHRRRDRSSLWPLVALAALALATAARPTPAETAVGNQGSGDRAAAPASAPGGSGRGADSPLDIPRRGWIEIAKRLYTEISDDRILAVAAGVTFYALLAVFPAVASVVSLYGLFADPATISAQLSNLATMLPGGAIDIIGEQVKRIASKPNTSLSIAFVSGLAISLWSANAGMKAMFDALNVAYEEKEKRGFVMLNAVSLAFTLGAIVFLLAAMGSVIVVPIVLNVFGLGGVGATLIALLRWPVMLLVVTVLLAVLYRYGPSRARAKWRWITWGSGIAAVLWLSASALFSIYVSQFGSYNETYGSLGAAIGFMTWIWISTIVILIGAELSAEAEHQTEVDTTVGAPKPVGQRGAAMADQVAASGR